MVRQVFEWRYLEKFNFFKITNGNSIFANVKLIIQLSCDHFLAMRNNLNQKDCEVSFGELQLTQISLNFKTSCCNLKTCLWELCFKVKESIDFVEEKSLIKTKWNEKWKIPHTVLERRTLRFSSYKNHKLKVNCYELELSI